MAKKETKTHYKDEEDLKYSVSIGLKKSQHDNLVKKAKDAKISMGDYVAKICKL